MYPQTDAGEVAQAKDLFADWAEDTYMSATDQMEHEEIMKQLGWDPAE